MSAHTCLSTRRFPIGTIVFSVIVFVFASVWLALIKMPLLKEEKRALVLAGWPLSYAEAHLCIALLLMVLFVWIMWLAVVKFGFNASLTCGAQSMFIFSLSIVVREAGMVPKKAKEQGGPTPLVELIVPCIGVLMAVICLVVLAFKRSDECRRCYTPLSPVVKKTLIVVCWLSLLTAPLHFSSSHQKRLVNFAPAAVMQLGISLAAFAFTTLFHDGLESLGCSAHWAGAVMIAFMWYLAREIRDFEKLRYFDADGVNIPTYGLTICYLMVETLHAILVRKEKAREDAIKRGSLLMDDESIADGYFGGVHV